MGSNLKEITSKIEKFVNCKRCGSCGVFAAWVAKVALKHGISDFTIVFGMVQLRGENGNWRDEHIWIEHKGKKIDPTIQQFFPYFIGYVGGKRKKFTPEEFQLKENFKLKKSWVKHHLV